MLEGLLRRRLRVMDTANTAAAAAAAAAADRALVAGSPAGRHVKERVAELTVANMSAIIPFMRPLEFRPRDYVKLPPLAAPPAAAAAAGGRSPPSPDERHAFHYKPPAWLDELE